jgi:hypothetical protein
VPIVAALSMVASRVDLCFDQLESLGRLGLLPEGAAA